MYLVTMSPRCAELSRLTMVPFRMRNFRLNGVEQEEGEWMRRTLDRECNSLDGEVAWAADRRAFVLVRKPETS